MRIITLHKTLTVLLIPLLGLGVGWLIFHVSAMPIGGLTKVVIAVSVTLFWILLASLMWKNHQDLANSAKKHSQQDS